MSSIIVANSNLDSAKKLAMTLKNNGLPVYGICGAGAQVIELANRHYHGGVIVCSIDLKDMPASNLPEVTPAAYDYLFIVKPHQAGMVPALESLSLMMPLSRLSLISTVNMLLDIAQPTSQSIKKRLKEEALDTKVLVEKAKQRLMERNYLTENQAHRFIQKKSMDTSKKLIEVAMIVLEMF